MPALWSLVIEHIYLLSSLIKSWIVMDIIIYYNTYLEYRPTNTKMNKDISLTEVSIQLIQMD